jgi:hypothetical protein
MKGINVNGSTVKSLLKNGAKFVEKQAPAICAGIAVAGLIGAVVSAVKAGPELKEALEEAHIRKNEEALKMRREGSDDIPIEELNLKEKAPIYARHLWKTTVYGVISIVFIAASVCFGHKQIKTLTVLAAAAESNLINFEGAVKDVVGDKKFDEIKRKVLDNAPDPQEEFIIETGQGDTLCYEPWFRTYFRMSIEAAKSIAKDCELSYHKGGELTFDEIYERYHLSKAPNIAEIMRRFNEGREEEDLLSDHGYFSDPEGEFNYPPSFEPYSKEVLLNGKEETCYVVAFNRPKSRWMYEHESEKFFRRKNR